MAFALTMAATLPMAAARPFIGILLWCWISFMNPHKQTYDGIADLPWAAIIFATTIFGCGLNREPKKFRFDTTTWLIVAFMLLMVVTTMTALFGDDRVMDKFFATEKMFLGVLLTVALLTDARRVHALVWIMVITIGYWGVRGGVFTLLTAGGAKVFGPEGTMINDNNHLAAALLVSVPLMAYLRMRSSHALIRYGLTAAIGLTLISVVGSYSRGALLGLVAMLGMMWLRSSNKVFGAIAAVAVIAAAFAFMPEDWIDRMNTLGEGQVDSSAQGRLDIWWASLQIAIARPLTGGGFLAPYAQFIVNQYAPGVQARAVHSIFFEVLGEHGFLGLGLFLSIVAMAALNTRRIIRASRGRPEVAWAYDLARMAQVSIVSYLVAGTFLSLCYWDYWYTFVVLLSAVRRLVEQAVPATAGQRGASPGRVVSPGRRVPAGAMARS